MSYFEIRTKVPTYGMHSGGLAENEDLYDQINVMCWLTAGIPYERFFDAPLLGVLQDMRLKLLSVPRPLDPDKVQAQAVAVVDAMIAWLDQPTVDPLTFRKLYTVDYPAGDPVHTEIVQRFAQLKQISGGRLCLPFLAWQGGQGNPVPNNAVDAFVAALGNLDYQALYELPKWRFPHIHAAVMAGFQAGILGAGEAQASSGGSKGSNYRQCLNNTCTDNTQNTYCNVATDGTCSTITP